MGVGPQDIRRIRTDSLEDMGTPASNDGVLVRDLTDGIVKLANVSSVGATIEQIQDNLGTSFIVGGNNLTVTYNDVGNALTFDVDALIASDITAGTFADARISQSSVTQHQAALSITESQISNLDHLTIEEVQDNLGTSFVVGGNNLTVTYNDTSNTLTFAVDTLVAADIPNLDTSKITTGTFANARISQSSVTQHEAALSITESQISNLDHLTIEEVQDNLGASFVVGGNNLTVTYNDTSNTLTFAVDTLVAADIPNLDTSKITTGTFADARISQSSVTQHQGAIDHGSVAGTGDDDHTIYSLASGARAFSGTVSGVSPTADAHLATKGYVDDRSPTGSIMMYGSITAPTGWLLCDGAAVSRSTYADLFAVVGTSYGTGDGSTTFNVPNFDGSFPAGTGNVSGYNAGVSGGANAVTLAETEIPAHTHTGPSHAHSIDPPLTATTGDNHGHNMNSDSHGHNTSSTGNHNHTMYFRLFSQGAGNVDFWTAVEDSAGTNKIAASTIGTGGHNHSVNTYNHVHNVNTSNHAHNVDIGAFNSANSGTGSTGSTGGGTSHENRPPYLGVAFIIKT